MDPSLFDAVVESVTGATPGEFVGVVPTRGEADTPHLDALVGRVVQRYYGGYGTFTVCLCFWLCRWVVSLAVCMNTSQQALARTDKHMYMRVWAGCTRQYMCFAGHFYFISNGCLAGWLVGWLAMRLPTQGVVKSRVPDRPVVAVVYGDGDSEELCVCLFSHCLWGANCRLPFQVPRSSHCRIAAARYAAAASVHRGASFQVWLHMAASHSHGTIHCRHTFVIW